MQPRISKGCNGFCVTSLVSDDTKFLSASGSYKKNNKNIIAVSGRNVTLRAVLIKMTSISCGGIIMNTNLGYERLTGPFIDVSSEKKSS